MIPLLKNGAGTFNEDVNTAINFCEKHFESFYTYQPYSVREMLVNMCFNLGPTRLAKFRHFLAALAKKDYAAAAGELKNSFWYNQVKDRARRIRMAIRNPQIPFGSFHRRSIELNYEAFEGEGRRGCCTGGKITFLWGYSEIKVQIRALRFEKTVVFLVAGIPRRLFEMFYIVIPVQ